MTEEKTEVRFTIAKEPMVKFLETVKEFSEDVILYVQRDGINVKTVDPANVALVEGFMPKKAFEKWDVDGGETLIGIDVKRILDILSVVEKGGLCNFTYPSESNIHRIKIMWENLTYEGGTLEPGMIRKKPTVPEIAYPGSVTLSTAAVSKALKGICKVSDTAVFKLERDTITIGGKGDTDGVKTVIGKKNTIDLRYAGDKPITSLFCMDYLDDIVKKLSKIERDGEIKISIGQDTPLTIEKEMDAFRLKIMLSPRLEDDSEERYKQVNFLIEESKEIRLYGNYEKVHFDGIDINIKTIDDNARLALEAAQIFIGGDLESEVRNIRKITVDGGSEDIIINARGAVETETVEDKEEKETCDVCGSGEHDGLGERDGLLICGKCDNTMGLLGDLCYVLYWAVELQEKPKVEVKPELPKRIVTPEVMSEALRMPEPVIKKVYEPEVKREIYAVVKAYGSQVRDNQHLAELVNQVFGRNPTEVLDALRENGVTA